MNIKQLEKSGLEAVMMLRKSKLSKGLPFMINSNTLPSGQCYLEYPNGLIVLVALNKEESDFKIINEFSSEESLSIKKKFNLD